MSIRYALIRSKLATVPDGYRAQVEHHSSIGLPELADAIARPGSTVTRAEILAYQEEFLTEVLRLLVAGHRIVLDYLIISLSIEGVFTDEDDVFDPARHRVRVVTTPNLRLRQVAADIQPQKVAPARRQPTFDLIEDFQSDAHNTRLTPGGVVRVRGAELKLDPADPRQGVWLVAADGTETVLGPPFTNRPSELLLMLPAALAPGTYRLLIRNCARRTQTLREARSPHPLTVA